MAGLENEAQMEQAPVDPWAAAFAALDQEDQENTEEPANTGDGDGGSDLSDTNNADEGEGAPAPEGGDGLVTAGEPGGPGDLGGADGGSNAGLDWDDIDISETGIQQYRDSVTERIHDQVLRDVAAAYVKQGARNTDGMLGATINDPDVCKRDSDGVPRFYNPETGREFTGDNPRRQAQEWVDDYNRSLGEAFNKTCAGYEKKLMEQEAPRLAVIEFAPKYQQLDPVRRSMFEAVIEDYEVRDEDGDVIGYSCDLNKALGAVNRQVRMIQQHYSGGKGAGSATSPVPPSGPALDTPTAGGGQQGGNAKPNFKSIAEAMEWEQDQILASMRERK